MSGLMFFVAMIAIGASLGVATLPWADRLSRGSHTDKPFLYVLGWAFFWPYLALMFLWLGIKAYRKAWWAYSDRRMARRYKEAMLADDEQRFPDFPANETVKMTFFKDKQ